MQQHPLLMSFMASRPQLAHILRSNSLQVGDNVLEDVKYVCNIPEQLARKIAKNVQPDMQLNEYLLYH